MKELRLLFEPNPGTCVNMPEMFRHYVVSWLDGFPIRWGGYITMPLHEKKHGTLEPVYQIIIDRPTTACRNYLAEYVNRNPLAGYTTHLYTREHNSNSVYEGQM